MCIWTVSLYYHNFQGRPNELFSILFPVKARRNRKLPSEDTWGLELHSRDIGVQGYGSLRDAQTILDTLFLPKARILIRQNGIQSDKSVHKRRDISLLSY